MNCNVSFSLGINKVFLNLINVENTMMDNLAPTWNVVAEGYRLFQAFAWFIWRPRVFWFMFSVCNNQCFLLMRTKVEAHRSFLKICFIFQLHVLFYPVHYCTDGWDFTSNVICICRNGANQLRVGNELIYQMKLLQTSRKSRRPTFQPSPTVFICKLCVKAFSCLGRVQ